MNRFGGNIFLGVLDDGTVLGVPEKAAPDMVKNFISCISNPALFTPTVYLSPEIIQYESKTIIRIHVSPGAEVYSYKKVIYDRVDDADVKVTATAQIAQMYIRKQGKFTERKVYPYVEKSDLRLDMLPKLRVMAQNQSSVQGHPWDYCRILQKYWICRSAGIRCEKFILDSLNLDMMPEVRNMQI